MRCSTSRSCDSEGDFRQAGTDLTVFEAVGDDSKNQSLHFRLGIFRRGTLSHLPRQPGNLGTPRPTSCCSISRLSVIMVHQSTRISCPGVAVSV